MVDTVRRMRDNGRVGDGRYLYIRGIRIVGGYQPYGGKKFITRHGSERAVILSVKDYRALTAHKPDLREYLLGGPKVDRFDVPRSRDRGRKVTL